MRLEVMKRGLVRIARALLGVYFCFCATMFLLVALEGAFRRAWRAHIHMDPAHVVVVCLIPAAFAVVFALGAWIAARGSLTSKLNGKAWLACASLLSLLITFGIPAFYFHRDGAGAFWDLQRFFAVPTVLGLIGLAIFWSVRRSGERLKSL